MESRELGSEGRPEQRLSISAVKFSSRASGSVVPVCVSRSDHDVLAGRDWDRSVADLHLWRFQLLSSLSCHLRGQPPRCAQQPRVTVARTDKLNAERHAGTALQ